MRSWSSKKKKKEMRSWNMRWSEWGLKLKRADEKLMCPKSREVCDGTWMGLGPHLLLC